MHKISQHPIIQIPDSEKTEFQFNGLKVGGEKGLLLLLLCIRQVFRFTAIV